MKSISQNKKDPIDRVLFLCDNKIVKKLTKYERRCNMATAKEPTVSFKKADIEHTLGILYQVQGFLEAKLQTGKAKQIEEVISILRKDG